MNKMMFSDLYHPYQHQRLSALHGSSQWSLPPRDFAFLLDSFRGFSSEEFCSVDDEGMAVPPLACSFAKMHQYRHMLCSVDEDGFVVLKDTLRPGQNDSKSWQLHRNAVFDVQWVPGQCKILSASGDQTVALHDMQTQQKLETFKGHGSSVKSVSFQVGSDVVFSSGSRDGHIMTWDMRVAQKSGAIPPMKVVKFAHTLMDPKEKFTRKRNLSSLANSPNVNDGRCSVTCVLYQNENYVISAGSMDPYVKVWDMRKTYYGKSSQPLPVEILASESGNKPGYGYSNLMKDSYGMRLFASCMDGHIYEYDLTKYGHAVEHFYGHKIDTFYVKIALSPDNKYLLSGSSNSNALIYQVDKPRIPPLILKGHTAEVTAVAWSPEDSTKFVTQSDDTRTKIWRIYCREQEDSKLPPLNSEVINVLKKRAEMKKAAERAKTSASIDACTISMSKPGSSSANVSSPGSYSDNNITIPGASKSVLCSANIPTPSSSKDGSYDVSIPIPGSSRDGSSTVEAPKPGLSQTRQPSPSATTLNTFTEETPSLQTLLESEPQTTSRPGQEDSHSTTTSQVSSDGFRTPTKRPPTSHMVGANRSGSYLSPSTSRPNRSPRGVVISPAKSPALCRAKVAHRGDMASPHKNASASPCDNETSAAKRVCLRNISPNPQQSTQPKDEARSSSSVKKILFRDYSGLKQDPVEIDYFQEFGLEKPFFACMLQIRRAQARRSAQEGCIDQNGNAKYKCSLMPRAFTLAENERPGKITTAATIASQTASPSGKSVKSFDCTASTSGCEPTTPDRPNSSCSQPVGTPSKQRLLTEDLATSVEQSSPTHNLPCSIRHGPGSIVTPPRQLPVKSTPTRKDWLTRMRLEKLSKSAEKDGAEEKTKSPSTRSPKTGVKGKGMTKIHTFFKACRK